MPVPAGDALRSILITETVERNFGAALEQAAPGIPRIALPFEGPTAAQRSALPAVDAVCFSGDLFPDHLRPFVLAVREIEDLRWLHTFSAGVDNVFFQRLLARGTRISTSSGAHATPIAQTVILYLLALTRDLSGWRDAQLRRSWEPRSIRDLQGLCLGVVGLGPIGLEVARLGAALRMEVIGVRRRPRGDEPCETWGLDRLPELWPRADALVLALPLTDETHRVLDEGAIAAMKPGAIVVNVGRGGLIDEAALVRALEAGRLGGAGLDVFEVEPLPEDSPLWSLPNVIVTPHSSGTTPGNFHRSCEIFVDNLARYVRGEPLQNEVPAPSLAGSDGR